MKNKLFLCFRPVGIETESQSNGADSFDDRVFTCITVANNRDSKISVVKSPVLDSQSSKCFQSAIHRSNRRGKSETSRSLSGVLKAVLFEISLRNKARSRKAAPLTLGSESSDSRKIHTFSDVSKSLESADSRIQRIERNSSPTQENLSDNEISLKQKKPSTNKAKECGEVKTENKRICCSSSNSALFLILIPLSITMFYGRFCAILFTSMSLYFLPRRSICERQAKNMAGSPPKTKLLAGDYRNKVIMEGLLDRNHQRRGH